MTTAELFDIRSSTTKSRIDSCFDGCPFNHLIIRKNNDSCKGVALCPASDEMIFNDLRTSRISIEVRQLTCSLRNIMMLGYGLLGMRGVYALVSGMVAGLDVERW